MIGLRSFLYISGCGYETDGTYSGCTTQMVDWLDDACKSGPLKSACDSCANSAASFWFTTVSTCVGCLIAWLGCQTRMRVNADIPVQKLLGMFADGYGAITLTLALSTFSSTCENNLKSSALFNGPTISGTSFWSGPGYWCFLICAIVGYIRCLLHWLTPLPAEVWISELICMK